MTLVHRGAGGERRRQRFREVSSGLRAGKIGVRVRAGNGNGAQRSETAKGDPDATRTLRTNAYLLQDRFCNMLCE
jgi:hypothetical protein